MRAAFDAAHIVMSARDAGRARFAHTAASITAIGVVGDELVVGQVGECRAYRVRDDRVELLAPDHTLATLIGTDDAFARGVVTRVVGFGELAVDVVSLVADAGDRVVICTRAIWQRDDRLSFVAALAAATDHAALDAITARCADQRDAAALVIAR